MTPLAAFVAVALGAAAYVIFNVAAGVSWDLSGFLAVVVFVVSLGLARVALLRRAR